MKTDFFKIFIICLLLAFTVQACGREYYYYQQHKSHSPKYEKRQLKYKRYHRHDNRVDKRTGINRHRLDGAVSIHTT